jgi:ADP-heptose:LPS heptosyltransferase
MGAAARPLVMRCGAFGDMVLLTPLLRQLHARYGTPIDVIASGPWTRPLLEGQPGVGELFVLGSRKMPYWLSPGQQALARWLRARGPGPTWFCDPGAGRELLARGGIPDSCVCDSNAMPWKPGQHFVDRWIEFASQTPPAFAGTAPVTSVTVPSAAVLEISAASRTALDAWLARRGLAGRPLILIQAGNKRTMRGWRRQRATNTKYWPEERWAEVIRAMRAEKPDHAILLLGVRAELALNEEIIRIAAVPNVHNVADDLPVPILLPLLERATSLVSVDTGPAHAAAALGCPTVALFGESDPALYRPGGVTTPAIVLTGRVDGRPNILGIEATHVIQGWREPAENFPPAPTLRRE